MQVELDGCPADPGRDGLYSADELYDTVPYAASLDARTYAWTLEHREPGAILAEVLHDQGVDDALGRWVHERQAAGCRVVGVMGGHASPRASAEYDEAARLGRLVGLHHTVATGGGPGAMEAANLGARLARVSEDAFDEALRRVGAVPSFAPAIDPWVAAAREALALPHAPVPTLGVPTWHYGHEPPNLFATAIAKYFKNALREAILLQVCDAGIVFLPGAGGTVQEIFQDACENYYATEDKVAPMVLVGREHWVERLPVWPLLQALARGRAMEGHVHLVDTVEEAAALLTG